jgi:hypothetical protein
MIRSPHQVLGGKVEDEVIGYLAYICWGRGDACVVLIKPEDMWIGQYYSGF